MVRKIYQVTQKDKKQLAFSPSSLILANNFLPVNLSRRTMKSDLVEPKSLPRWITLPLGLVLFPFTLLCILGSAIMLLAPNVPPSIFTISIGSVFLIGSIWVSLLLFRLIVSNPKKSKGFVSPVVLRIIGVLFVAMPIMALAVGTFMDKPVIYSIQAIIYFCVAAQLFRIANIRANKKV